MTNPAGQIELPSPSVVIPPFLPPSPLPISPLAKSPWPTFWASDYTSSTSLCPPCACFDRRLCQARVLQWRLSFMLTALPSYLPSHHTCQQCSLGQSFGCWRWAEFCCLGWCLPSMFSNRAFSPLPKALLRPLSINACTCHMKFPFSWDS